MTDDTQRELEQRALRNVRGLVDSLEGKDQADHRVQKKLLATIVVGAVVGLAILAGVVVYSGNKPASKAIVIEERAGAKK